MKKTKTSGSKNPTVNLAINKSRIKQYDSGKKVPSYYLEKGQEFQIEIYNPTPENVLATIKLNNKEIEGGLVVRPGERVFLDRFLNSNKRFLFDTYLVENTKSTKKAIESNGDIEVAFFKEIITKPKDIQVYKVGIGEDISGNAPFTFNTLNNTTGGTNLHNNIISTNGPIFTPCGTTTSDVSFTTTTSSTNNNMLNFSNPESSVSLDSLSLSKNKLNISKKRVSLETGRVEKGSKSNQQLKKAGGEFELISYHVVRFKLLPKSEQLITSKQYLTKYCTNCGAKCKTKFCPFCGTKQ